MTYADQGASSVVGDIPGYGEDAYFDEEAAYAEPNYVAPAGHATVSDLQYAPGVSPQFAPVGAAELQPAAYQQVGLQALSGSSYGGACSGGACSGGCGGACGGGCESGSCSFGGCDSYNCGGGCDGGCDSGCKSGGGLQNCCFGGLFNSCNHDTWAQAEMLLWFTSNRKMAPLVTNSPPGTLPVLDNPQTNVVFGDEIQGEISGGLRLDYGKWVTENVGFGGRFWGLANNNDSYAAAGDGTGTSIGRPFLDLAFGGESAVLVNYDGSGAAQPSFAGGVVADSSLSIWGAEAYSRVRFSCAKNCRLDFIGGYSHFNIHDELGIASTSINIANPATGRTRSFADLFDVENEFNGGQVGFEMVITRGRWMARSLTKIHLGNMNQNTRIAGISVDETPGAGGAVINSGGLLAQGNQGEYERDVFAFAPEANFKLGYRLHNSVLLSVGYSFIYWDNVALAGDAVDPVVSDGSQLGTGTFGARPAFAFDDSSLWVQGLDLGVIIDF